MRWVENRVNAITICLHKTLHQCTHNQQKHRENEPEEKRARASKKKSSKAVKPANISALTVQLENEIKKIRGTKK